METPELDKMSRAREAGSQQVGEFLDWLRDTRGVTLYRSQMASHEVQCSLCRGSGTLREPLTEQVGERTIRFTAMPGETCPRCEGTGEVVIEDGMREVPWLVGTQDLLAEYFGVDLLKVEAEKRALLEEMRNMHE